MNIRRIAIALSLCACACIANAQIYIKAGVNMSNEIKLFEGSSIQETFRSENLQGFNIGLMYQGLSKKGIGAEVGIVFAQKGSNFTYTDSTTALIGGYNRVNYVEIPLNLKYIFRIGVLGIYATAGIYGSCAFSGKTILEEDTNIETLIQYNSFKDRLDAGYNVGLGFELFKKIQLGAAWSQGFIDMNTLEGIIPTGISTETNNRVLSINLAYIF